MKTCKEIYEMISQHCNCISIFVCAHAWEYESCSVIAENMDEDDFIVLFGNNFPAEWKLRYNEIYDSIEICFLFK